MGKSRSAVANTLRALAAPQMLQDAVVEGKISEGHLRALLPLPLSDAILGLGEVLAKGLSVRETEILVRKILQASGRPARVRARLRGSDPEVQHLVTELRAALGTKVEILRGRKGGRITIEYYSAEDLSRLYELLIQARRS